MSQEQSPEKHHHSLFDSFRYAFNGIKELRRRERNFRIHILIASVACVLAFALQFNPTEWCILLLTIGFVTTAEALNTALEALVDFVEPNQHPLAKKAKDIAAGAVLIAALISVMIGMLLFVLPIWDFVSHYLE